MKKALREMKSESFCYKGKTIFKCGRQRRYQIFFAKIKNKATMYELNYEKLKYYAENLKKIRQLVQRFNARHLCALPINAVGMYLRALA